MSTNTLSIHIEMTQNDFTLGVDVEFLTKGITAVFGRSGSGKTTLLRAIAGLEKAQGSITFNGESWQGEKEFISASERNVGYVFQGAYLFAHLSVEGNLRYSWKRRDKNNTDINYDEIIQMLGVGQLLQRMPETLSGGESQRVAIARALMNGPQLLLLDEPLTGLDNFSKAEIMPYLVKLHQQLNIPIILVTHSVDEIARLADYVIFLQDGSVVKTGALLEVLSDLNFPAFGPQALSGDIGVVIEGKSNEINQSWQLKKVVFNGGELWVKQGQQQLHETVRVRVLAKDISLALQHHQDTSIVNILQGVIQEIKPEPENSGSVLIKVKVGETPFIARITQRSLETLNLTLDMPVWLQIKSVALV